ncbi:MAG: hypothetical protein Q8L49_07295 [Burkholderiaceae bacterium]|nr:hypothetical protein [Burkholderiaceae bacterium]
MEYIELGPVRAGETCAQVGTDNYLARSMGECEVFRRMLERVLPIPEGLPMKYAVRSHPHDFGNYREVSIRYDEANGQAVEFAYEAERSVPAEWDAIARYDLAWYERKRAYELAVQEKRQQTDEVPTHFGTTEPPGLPAGSPFSELLATQPL